MDRVRGVLLLLLRVQDLVRDAGHLRALAGVEVADGGLHRIGAGAVVHASRQARRPSPCVARAPGRGSRSLSRLSSSSATQLLDVF